MASGGGGGAPAPPAEAAAGPTGGAEPLRSPAAARAPFRRRSVTVGSACSRAATAEAILGSILPNVGQAVLGRLRQEKVRTAEDLCGLDKGDLAQLGFKMVERSRVLRWARSFDPSAQARTPISASRWRGEQGTPLSPRATPPASPAAGHAGSGELGRSLEAERDRPTPRLEEADDVESQAEFWCGLAVELGWRLDDESASGADLDVLEALFDLSAEHIHEVYHSMRPNEDGNISVNDLSEGLARWKVPPIDEAKLRTILGIVDENDDGHLQLVEFQTILKRLLLARLLADSEEDSPQTARSSRPECYLAVVDYNSHYGPERQEVYTGREMREFFFCHRKVPPMPPEARHNRRAEEPLIRWMHMDIRDTDTLRDTRLDMSSTGIASAGCAWTSNGRWLLGLAIKYGLHPLAVEDVLDRSPTKFDRFGQHFFITLEKLFLASADQKGSQLRGKPVALGASHLAIFCAGPPHYDTLITVSQTDGPAEARGKADRWIGEVNGMISSTHSRVRERGCNFLLYKILDEYADDLLNNVVNAYVVRLQELEKRCTKITTELERRVLWDEVQESKQELARVERRIRGLQRVVRRIADDPDLVVGLTGYMDDVQEHLDEAQDIAAKAIMTCDGVLGTYQQEQEHLRARQADRQNNILFVLTIVTAVFTPMTFIAGVYGMNFVDKRNRPTIPELTMDHGYALFWFGNMLYLVLIGVVLCCLFIWPGCCATPALADGAATEAEVQPLLPRAQRSRRKLTRDMSKQQPPDLEAQRLLQGPRR